MLSPFPLCQAKEAPGREAFLSRPDMTDEWQTSWGSLDGSVVSEGVLNYRGARIPLVHQINIPEWRKVVDIIKDKSLPDMLEFGFPSGHLSTEVPTVGLTNYASATRNPSHIHAFLGKETGLSAMVGPFREAPFVQWFRSNPLITRPKRGSEDLRVILDLSFPVGSGVNAGISREEPDGPHSN